MNVAVVNGVEVLEAVDVVDVVLVRLPEAVPDILKVWSGP